MNENANIVSLSLESDLSQSTESSWQSRAQYNRWFKITADRSSDAVLVTNREGLVVECNHVAEEIFGYQRQDIVGHNIDLLNASKQHPHFFTEILAKINCAARDIGSGVSAVEKVLTSSGQPILMQITPIATGQESSDAVLFFFRRENIATRDAAEEQNSEALTRQMIQTVESIARAVDVRDPFTAIHQRRVAHLGRAIAEELDLPTATVEAVYLSGSLHDIGKISIPLEILSRPGRLDHASMDLIRQHSTKGYEIVRYVDFSWPIAKIILQHHERLDGSGYPNHLTGDQIILEAKILGVADVVEAMVSHRPYRSCRSLDEALNEVISKPHLYDESIAEVCRRLFLEKGYQFSTENHLHSMSSMA